MLMLNTKHIIYWRQGSEFIGIENNQIIEKIINITNQHKSKYQYNKPCLYFFMADFEEHQEDIYPTLDEDDERDDDYFDKVYEKDG